MIVGKVVEEPEDQVFRWRNVTMLNVAIKVGENDAETHDQNSSDKIDQHGLSGLLFGSLTLREDSGLD